MSLLLQSLKAAGVHAVALLCHFQSLFCQFSFPATSDGVERLNLSTLILEVGYALQPQFQWIGSKELGTRSVVNEPCCTVTGPDNWRTQSKGGRSQVASRAIFFQTTTDETYQTSALSRSSPVFQPTVERML